MGNCAKCGTVLEMFLLDEFSLEDVTITPIGQRCPTCSFVDTPSRDELMPVEQ